MATTRSQRLERRVIVFGVLLCAFTAIALLRPSRVSGVSSKDMQPMAVDFDATSIREIHLQRVSIEGTAGDTLRVTKSNQGWTLPDRFGYPALPGAAVRLLDDVADARARAAITRRQETFPKYATVDGWTHVKLTDESGAVAADFQIGRTDGADVFIKWTQDSVEQVHRVVNFRPRRASTDFSLWIENKIWPEGIKDNAMVRLDLAALDAKPLTLVKRGASSEQLGVPVPEKDPDDVAKVWVIITPTPGDADPFQVKPIAQAFAGMMAEDVVARSQAPEELAKYGFDAPEVSATFWERVDESVRKHTLQIGKQSEDSRFWYVRRADKPWIFQVPTGAQVNPLRTEAGQLLLRDKGN